MHAIRVASAALLSVTALTLSASAALAGNGDGNSDGGRDSGRGNNNITSFGFNVQPQSVAAGGRLRLNAESCDSVTRVSSGVFDTVTIPKGQSSATALIDGDARAGAVYEVTFQCGNESGHTELTIASGRSETGGHTGQSQLPAPVQRGAKAGVGGSVGGGFDLKEICLGTALIAGCVGTAWSMSRRRATDDES
ncbi:hypothetical protein OG585_05685 [Streptomyces sp. NBC_01340]|uniref:hypothetical protein n=1 Tax=unclassified Streptomyces TaxID=2593676 RepID=UPI00224FD2FC|nr:MULTISPECIES: hypothetical protein [unclassified Streptomyces]MCX4593911.1 hypothetical protein [Streptomyces sp. NBC_01549]WSI36816.1 hypothetical protein OG585_05685 [Streptomyces sp. NBC_01340]